MRLCIVCGERIPNTRGNNAKTCSQQCRDEYREQYHHDRYMARPNEFHEKRREYQRKHRAKVYEEQKRAEQEAKDLITKQRLGEDLACVPREPTTTEDGTWNKNGLANAEVKAAHHKDQGARRASVRENTLVGHAKATKQAQEG